MKSNVIKIALVSLGVLIAIGWLRLLPKVIDDSREEKHVEQTFDEYSSSLVNRYYEHAYAACGNDFRQITSYDEFVGIYKSIDNQHGILKSVKLTRVEMHGSGTPRRWAAVIYADFVYPRETLRFEFGAHKDDNRWVISGFKQL